MKINTEIESKYAIQNSEMIFTKDTKLELLEAIFNSSNEIIIVTNAVGTIKVWNRTAEQIFELTSESVLRKNINDVLDIEKHIDFNQIIAKLEKGEKIEGQQLNYTLKSKKEITLTYNVNPKFNEFGILKDVIINACFLKSENFKSFKNTFDNHDFKGLIDNLPSVIYQFMMDENQHFSFPYLSKEAVNLLGVSVEELYVNPLAGFENIHNDDAQALFQSIYLSKENLTKWEFTFRIFIPETASYRWIRGVSKPIEIGKDKVLWNGVFSDVTLEKENEEKIKKSEANLNAIIENTDAFVYSLNTRFEIITFNSAYKEILKQQANIDLKPGDNIFDITKIFSPNELDFWKNIYTDAMLGNPQQFIKEFNHDSLNTFISFSINPIFKGEEIIGLSCLSRDISKQKTDEEVIRKSEANLHTIFDNTDIGYVLIDSQLNFLSFNQPAKKFACENLNIEFKIGASAAKTLNFAQQKEILEILKDVLDARKTEFSKSFQQKDGSEKWFQFRFFPIQNTENSVLGIMLTISDITELKLYVKAIEEQNTKLKEIAWTQSHIVRAPLARLMGLVNLLGKTNENSVNQKEMYKYIMDSSKELDDIIRDIVKKSELIR